ncbi:hypothetical protein GCM10020255_024230 [Rhodococcus baikonurensis]
MKAQHRSATATVSVFAGFGLVCGLVGAAVLWWYVSQPFTIYTASYQPHDIQSFQIETVSVNRFIIGLIVGGPLSGPQSGHSFQRRAGISYDANARSILTSVLRR